MALAVVGLTLAVLLSAALFQLRAARKNKTAEESPKGRDQGPH